MLVQGFWRYYADELGKNTAWSLDDFCAVVLSVGLVGDRQGLLVLLHVSDRLTMINR
jgi:hypothetical protein